jgi:hypothetical protein
MLSRLKNLLFKKKLFNYLMNQLRMEISGKDTYYEEGKGLILIHPE